MTKPIIDRFEVVQIDQDEADGIGRGIKPDLVCSLFKGATVEEASQAVALGHELSRFEGMAQFIGEQAVFQLGPDHEAMLRAHRMDQSGQGGGQPDGGDERDWSDGLHVSDRLRKQAKHHAGQEC